MSRFDGDTFRTFTVHDGLISDQVFALLCDRSGRLWVGALDRGLCWYEDGAFQRFGPEAWCSRRGAEFLFEDSRGRVWCAGGVPYRQLP